MSKVALRVYNREIESLIDQGHIDEAVAHCQHILKTYPKHLETYRLLGKAQLELHRYTDAADVFQRVLLAVPDDFVSHLGMSIVSDEQKDLDGAIWHMERAFEISSTNAGVQGELRRLRGRRDGMEPPKIQLTRGALAQIYTKGGEYQQAIAEIKAVLAEDETRSDMKTLLARAYFRAGLRNEAIEACIDLLKQYPYSLEGNRILVEILPGTSMAQGVEQYKRRLEALDPYYAFATGPSLEIEGVVENAVMIERHEWDPNSQPVASWNMPAAPAAPPPAAAPAVPAEEIPDWMKQSGWGESTGEFKDGPINFDEPEPSAPAAGDQLATAEIPDWLKAMAPPGATTAPSPSPSAPASSSSSEDADFDWLAGLGAPVSAQAAQPAQPVPPTPADTGKPASFEQESFGNDLDWLNNLGAETAPAAGGLAADAGLDWLNDLSPVQEDKSAQPPADAAIHTEESLPAWLTAGESSEPAASAEPLPWETLPEQPALSRTPDFASPLEMPAQSEPVADWLKDLSGEGSNPPLSNLVSGSDVSDDEQDEAFKWLESLGGTQEAKTEEHQEPVPGWAAQGSQPAEPVQAEPAPVQAAPVPPVQRPAARKQDDDFVPGPLSGLVSGPGTSSSEQDDAMLWLESLAQKQGAKAEELITNPSERTESAPDWVAQVGQTPDVVKPPEPAQAAPVQPPTQPAPAPSVPAQKPSARKQEDDFVPGPLSGLVSGPGTSSSEQDDALLWLESLAQKQGAKAEELITNPNERTESAPDWVAQVGQTPDVVKPPEPAQAAPVQPPTQPAPAQSVPTPVPPAQKPPARKQDDDFVPGPLSGLVSGPGTSSSEQDDALLWLESLAQKQGAKAEELITKPSERTESAPDWVAQVGQTPDVVKPPEPVQAAPVESPVQAAPAQPAPVQAAPVPPVQKPPARKQEEDFVPGPLSGLVSGPGTSSSEQDDALLWLESLAQKQGAKAEELITNPNERTESAPDWVAQVGQTPDVVKPPEPVQAAPVQPPTQPAPAQSVPTPVPPAPKPSARKQEEDFVPGPLSGLVSGPGTSSSEQDDALLWLESLAQKQGAKAEELITNPNERTESAPDWVAQVGQTPDVVKPSEPAVEAKAEAPAETPVADDSLDWLQGLGGEMSVEAGQPLDQYPSAVEAPASSQLDEGLDWLNNLGQPAEEPSAQPAASEPQPAAEAMPDWLSGLGQTEEPAAAPETPVTPAAPEPQPAADAMPDWLSGLGQTEEPAAAPETPVTPAAPEPQPAADAIPDWLSDLGGVEPPAAPETPAAPASPEPQPAADAIPDWLSDLGGVEPPAAQPEIPAWEPPAHPAIPEPQPAVEPVSDWLASLEQTDRSAEPMPWEQEAPAEVVHPEATAWEPVEPVAQPAAAPETPSTVEVSDWLTNLDEPEPVAAAPAEKPAGESEDLPAWLKDASADENPPAPEPGFGWVAAQLAAKKEALGLGSSSREPASEPPAEVVPPPQPAPAPVKQVPPPQRPALRQTGMLGSDKDAQAVQRARDSLSHGGLDAAMNEYTKLIKKNKMLEDVIYDLQEAVYSHPVDVIVWQTLGDAYMRSNRLQDALDAYSKAEELLR